MGRRSGPDRRVRDRRDPNNTQEDIIRKWLEKSPADREGDFQRFKSEADAEVRRTRILRGHPSTTEAICQYCGLLKPFADFTKNVRERDGLDRYCRACVKQKRQGVATENLVKHKGGEP